MRTQVVRGRWDSAQPVVGIRILWASGVGQYSWRAATMAAPCWCKAFPGLAHCGLAGLWLLNVFSRFEVARATWRTVDVSTHA
jgi:hypothetical protein